MTWDQGPFTTGLPKAFTGNSFNFPNSFAPKSPSLGYFGKDLQFNGDTSQNLLAGGRAFGLDIVPRSSSLADAAGLYRAGSTTGPGYQDRFDQYTKEAPGDRAYLNCLAGMQ